MFVRVMGAVLGDMVAVAALYGFVLFYACGMGGMHLRMLFVLCCIYVCCLCSAASSYVVCALLCLRHARYGCVYVVSEVCKPRDTSRGMRLRILFVLSLLVVWEVWMLVRMHVWVCKEVHVQSSSSEHVQSPAYTCIAKLYAARVQSAQSCMQHGCAAKLYAA